MSSGINEEYLSGPLHFYHWLKKELNGWQKRPTKVAVFYGKLKAIEWKKQVGRTRRPPIETEQAPSLQAVTVKLPVPALAPVSSRGVAQQQLHLTPVQTQQSARATTRVELPAEARSPNQMRSNKVKTLRARFPQPLLQAKSASATAASTGRLLTSARPSAVGTAAPTL